MNLLRTLLASGVACAAAAATGAQRTGTTGPTGPVVGPPGSVVGSGIARGTDRTELPGPPNVLVIVADDVGVDNVGAYGVGGDLPATPSIDALAGAGVLFRNVWANPICSPTRAQIQTGRFSVRTGIGWIAEPAPILTGLPLSEVTLPEMLDAGTDGSYAHAAFGKWHLGDGADVGGAFAPNLAGYDHYAGSLGNVDDYYDFEKTVDGVTTTVSNEYVTRDQVTDALAWMQTAPEPWFCYLAFNSAHAPWHAPPPTLHSVDLSGAGPPEVDSRPYYKAMVEAMDSEIGRLVAGMGDLELDTTIIFIGDNGTPVPVTVPPFVPSHAKGTGYEGGVGVPMIVTGPQVTSPGSECEALVCATDLFATVAEIAGVRLRKMMPDVELDSISFLDYLADPQLPSRRKHSFAERFFPNGPTAGLPVAPPQPGASCQPDLGFGGPGSAVLSMCGPPLAIGNKALMSLTGAPPLASATLLQSTVFSPTPLAGGTLTPIPIQIQTPLTTDAAGNITLNNFPMVGAQVSLYLQVLVDDLSQPAGFTISNTLRADFQPWNTKSIRNQRYKLIDYMNGGPLEMYDLARDPFELDDLLQDTLTPEQSAAFAELTAELADFVTP